MRNFHTIVFSISKIVRTIALYKVCVMRKFIFLENLSVEKKLYVSGTEILFKRISHYIPRFRFGFYVLDTLENPVNVSFVL